MQRNTNWTREELIVAYNLYCKLPFGRLHNRNPEIISLDISDLPPGMEREAIVRTRVNQGFFRSTILAAYNSKCCITGLAIPEFLNASHIVPWAIDPKNCVNPQNGLCLNAIHDRAFDRGLLTITPDYRVKLSPSLKTIQDDEAIANLLFRYDGHVIDLPGKFLPDVRFIEYHNLYVFRE